MAAARRISARAARGQRRADVHAVAEARAESTAAPRAARCAGDRLPAGGSRAGRAARRGRPGGSPADALDHDPRFAFGVGAKRSRSTPAGTTRERAGEPLAGPGERPRRSSRAACRSARAGGRAALRRGGYPSRSGSTNVAAVVVSDSSSATYESPGMAGSKPWTTSKSPRRSAVATFARTPDRDADRRRAARPAPRARRRTTPSSSPRLEGAATREEVGRARRRREHDDAVPSLAERVRDAGDVLVRVVRDRPGVRGHEADAERHGSRIVGRALLSPRGRGHDHRPRERALQDRRAGHDRRRGGRRVRDPGGKGDRALPLRALGHEAVLRRVAPAGRVRRRGARGRPRRG